jgi:hypothetical protein
MSCKRVYPVTMGVIVAVLLSVATAVMGQVTNTRTKHQYAFRAQRRKDEVQGRRYHP